MLAGLWGNRYNYTLLIIMCNLKNVSKKAIYLYTAENIKTIFFWTSTTYGSISQEDNPKVLIEIGGNLMPNNLEMAKLYNMTEC